MKIHQIVSENPLSAIKAGVSAYRATRAAPSIVKKTAPAAKTAAKPKAANTAATPKSASWWESEAAKLSTKISGKETALAAGALKSTVLASKADDIVRIMYALGALKEVGVYWYRSEQIENDSTLSPEQKQAAIRQLRGELMVTIIAPKIGAWGISKVAKWSPLSLVPWLTKLSGSPNAAELMKHLSKRGVEAALITWFAAGDGKQWLNNTFGFLISGIGSAPELVGTVYEITKAATQAATGNVPAGSDGDSTAVDPNDPLSIMNKVSRMMGGGGYVDPFIGTGRGGK